MFVFVFGPWREGGVSCYRSLEDGGGGGKQWGWFLYILLTFTKRKRQKESEGRELVLIPSRTFFHSPFFVASLRGKKKEIFVAQKKNSDTFLPVLLIFRRVFFWGRGGGRGGNRGSK